MARAWRNHSHFLSNNNIHRTTSLSLSLSLSLHLTLLPTHLDHLFFSFFLFFVFLHLLSYPFSLIDLGLGFDGGSVRALLPFPPPSRPFDNIRGLRLSILDILGLHFGDIFWFYTGKIRFGPSFCRIPRIVTQFPYTTRLSRIRPLYYFYRQPCSLRAPFFHLSSTVFDTDITLSSSCLLGR